MQNTINKVHSLEMISPQLSSRQNNRQHERWFKGKLKKAKLWFTFERYSETRLHFWEFALDVCIETLDSQTNNTQLGQRKKHIIVNSCHHIIVNSCHHGDIYLCSRKVLFF